MLISPDDFAKTYIDDKSPADIWPLMKDLHKIIIEYRNRINESSSLYLIDDGTSLASLLLVHRLYYEKAKAALESSKPKIASPERETSFQHELATLEKIEFSIGGYFGRSNTTVIRFRDTDVVFEQSTFESSYYHKGHKIQNRHVIPNAKPIFLKALADLHLEKWEDDYVDPDILDGTQWELELTFKNGTARTWDGSNAYPPNFTSLCELMGVADTAEDLI